MTQSAYDTIVAYHEATKHHFHRYARSAEVMDWANQPNPFRSYKGVEKIHLPLCKEDPTTEYETFFHSVNESGSKLCKTSLSSFFAFSLGLSAWKKVDTSCWALRINPSSGNLHPTESHLIASSIADFKGGVFHYSPFEHALERRAHLSDDLWDRMTSHFRGPGFIIALSTIFWRESWKYGERAYRYCNLDVGHALAALSFAARMHNWELTCLTGMGDQQIRTMLGFDRTTWAPLEEEVPELACWVSVKTPPSGVPQALTDNLVRPFSEITFSGSPNQLSWKSVDWPIITNVSKTVEKPKTTPAPGFADTSPIISTGLKKSTAAKIIRGRRSAVHYHPQRSISSEVFQSILNNTLVRTGAAPFAVRLMPPNVHLLLFVHRVTDIAPGLYLLVRRSEQLKKMKSRFCKDFLWQHIWPDFPLYLLKEMDVKVDAMELCCHQEIARDSAFAVAMISTFKDILCQAPYKYRHLHWECGMIGQVLYLEAEANGIGGTGIGCFFDDPVHQLLGIEDNTYQSLYHFTVGYPIEDTRLETLPAYHHLMTADR